MNKGNNMYQWKKKYSHQGIDPNLAGEELERIRDERNKLDPGVIVEESTPVSAPLHPAFTWDDATAAHKFRKTEARRLVESIIVIDEIAGTPPAPAYYHVKTQGHPRYEPVELVVDSMDLYASALIEIEKQMSGLTIALERLKEAAGRSEQPEHLGRISIAIETARALDSAITALH